MTLHTVNSNGSTDLLSAEVIHKDSTVLIVAMPLKLVPDAADVFWAVESKDVILSDDVSFQAKSWAHFATVNSTAIFKFYAKKQEYLGG